MVNCPECHGTGYQPSHQPTPEERDKEVARIIGDIEEERTIRNTLPTPESDIEKMYMKIKPLVKRMKAKYPKESNIEGLEPALTSDIAEIVLEVLADQKTHKVATPESVSWEKEFDERFVIQDGEGNDVVASAGDEDDAGYGRNISENNGFVSDLWRDYVIKNFISALLSTERQNTLALYKKELGERIEGMKIDERTWREKTRGMERSMLLKPVSYNSALSDILDIVKGKD